MGIFGGKSTFSFAENLDRYLDKVAGKLKKQASVQLLVHSDKLGGAYHYPPEERAKPFHIASAGKLFTAILVVMLSERGALCLDDPIARYIPQNKLQNLFVYQGVDYASGVTIKNLLAHTSGVADYFDDPVAKGIRFRKNIVASPNTFWTPDMLLDFSRHNQKAVGRPDARFHYSDTGYILLGVIIEQVTQKPFHVNLQDEFFIPLRMNDSYLMFYSEPACQPKKPLQKIWFDGTEVSQFVSLSCDWAGGGIISTTSDLLKFQLALRGGRLISEAALKGMEVCNNKFRAGMHYGLGMMEIRFEEFFFLLKGLPRVTGHSGVLGTHLYYDRMTETHIVMNFGSTAQMATSFRAMIEVFNSLKRLPGK